MLLDINPELIFEVEIERLISSRQLGLIEAICFWCETRGLEIEYAASLVKKNKNLKSKLAQEAEGLKMLIGDRKI